MLRHAARRAAALRSPASPRLFAGAASRVVEVKSDAEYAAALKGASGAPSLTLRVSALTGHPGLVVADFTAAWCGPCKLIAPVFEQLATAHPEVTFVKADIDTDGLQATVAAAGVTAVPTFVFLKGGVRLQEVRGADQAALKAGVDKHK